MMAIHMALIKAFPVVSTGMLRPGFTVAVLALTTACAQPPDATPTPMEPSASGPVQVNPSNIKRVRGELPADYEIADVTGQGSPAGFWGLGVGWTADPPQCAALVNPAGVDAGTAQGVSGSGDGGIVYAVVAAAPAPVLLDPALIADCGQWTMTLGRSTAGVNLIDAPRIEGVDTVGMASDTRTFVEAGTETASRALTFTAYLGDYFAFVTQITDPGSPHPPLQPQFAADLLVKTVSALRG